MADDFGTVLSSNADGSWSDFSVNIDNTAQATFEDPNTGANSSVDSNTVSLDVGKGVDLFNSNGGLDGNAGKGEGNPPLGLDLGSVGSAPLDLFDGGIPIAVPLANGVAGPVFDPNATVQGSSPVNVPTIDTNSATNTQQPDPTLNMPLDGGIPIAVPLANGVAGPVFDPNATVQGSSPINVPTIDTNSATNTQQPDPTLNMPLDGGIPIAVPLANGVAGPVFDPNATVQGSSPVNVPTIINMSNIQASADVTGAAITAAAKGPVAASMLPSQELLDAAANGVRATDLDAKDAIAFKNAGVDMTEIGTTPTQLKDLNQMIAAGGARPNDSAADGASVLVASANLRGSPVSADGTDIAKLPGLGPLPGPVRVNGPGLKPNDPKFPGAGLYAPDPLNSWSTNADVNRVVSNAVRDKGSNTALNKGSNVENATRDVLDKVSGATKFGLQLKTGFKPDALYPLGGVAQNAVIAKEEDQGATSLSSVRRFRDILAGRTPEPLTAAEIMTQYDKGLLPKQPGNTDFRVVGSTAGEVKRVAPLNFGIQPDDLTGRSQTMVEAQRRDGPGSPWVRAGDAIVRASEKTTSVSRPLEAIELRTGNFVVAKTNTYEGKNSVVQAGGKATITQLISPTAPERDESYKPRDVDWNMMWGRAVPVLEKTKIESSGVAIVPSEIGNVYRAVDKWNNPRIIDPNNGQPVPRVMNFTDNGIKTLEVQTNRDFVDDRGSKHILTEGYGSWKIGREVQDGRAGAGRWGKYE
jgi:hypothetical protein